MPTPARSAGKKSRRRRRLPRSIVASIDTSKILGVRAGKGSDHRFIGIWVVVLDGRVFVRSWSRKAGGWYRTFLEDPVGAIQVGAREVPVRAVRVRRQALLIAVEAAYPGSTRPRAHSSSCVGSARVDAVRRQSSSCRGSGSVTAPADSTRILSVRKTPSGGGDAIASHGETAGAWPLLR